MRKFLGRAGMMAVMMLLMLMMLALMPHLGTIGLVLTVLLIIVLVVGAVVVMMRLVSWGSSHMLTAVDKSLDVAIKKEQLAQERARTGYLLARPGEKIYGFFREEADTRPFTPVTDPSHITIHEAKQPALPAPEEPKLLEGSRLPSAEAFRTIWSSITAQIVPLGYRVKDGVSRAIMAHIGLLLSTLIVGQPGTGKSSLLRFLIAIVVKAGGFCLVWDKHNSILGEAANNPMIVQVYQPGLRLTKPGSQTRETATGHCVYLAREYRQMGTSLKAIKALLDERIALGEDESYPYCFWLIDEYLDCAENVPEAKEILLKIISEGRKYNIFVAVAGHAFNAEIIGGTKVKHNCSTQYAFKTHELQAAMIGFEQKVYKERFLQVIQEELADLAEQALTEKKDPSAGWCLLQGKVLGPTLVKIPNVTEQDLLWAFGYIMQMMPAPSHYSSPGYPEGWYAPTTPTGTTHLTDMDAYLGPVAEPEAVEALPPLLPPSKPGQKDTQTQEELRKRIEEKTNPLKEPLLSVSKRFPHVSRVVIEQIWLHYVIHDTPRRDLPKAMGKGGDYYQEVIKPICDAFDDARAALPQKKER